MKKDFAYYLDRFNEIGFVEEVGKSLVVVNGLPNVHANEVLLFETGEIGQVFSLYRESVSVMLFAKQNIPPGTRVVRTGASLTIPVGLHLIGKVINAFGEIQDSATYDTKTGPVEYRPIEVTPLPIVYRKEITKPFDTGVTVVDMLIPLGKGQRQLIIGDRKTGKTTFLLQTLYNQTLQGTICIYAAIGKQQLDVQTIEHFCREKGIIDKVILLTSFRHDSEGLIYITPFSVMTIAEYFRDQGEHVLLILDDLTTHAKAYREISLLAKRYPGRNSYPPNIFHIHAKLLERAGNFIVGESEASMTCLPVVETTGGDLSGYIQTNIMSMTDGHIFFDVNVFEEGRRPAINTTLSVSRVGRQTQSLLRGSIASETLSFINLLKRVEKYSHFGQEASEEIHKILSTGSRLMNLLDQQGNQIVSPQLQLFLLALLWIGVWDNLSADEQQIAIEKIVATYDTTPELRHLISSILESAKNLSELTETIVKEKINLTKLLGVTFSDKKTTQ